jgi:NAD kinase
MKILVVCKRKEQINQQEIRSFFQKAQIEAEYIWKNELKKAHIDKKDAIISIGGDGTALSAAHFITSQPILAVNSEPEASEGALTTIILSQLEEKLNEIKSIKFKTENLERIEIAINGKILDMLALNEVFIGSEKAYLPAKYTLNLKSKSENQISSGLIFSTGTGSTAWFKSAGGKQFSPQAKFIKLVVREPFKGRIKTCDIPNADINENEEAVIIPQAKSELAIDSIRSYPLNPGDKITLKISKHPLKRII